MGYTRDHKDAIATQLIDRNNQFKFELIDTYYGIGKTPALGVADCLTKLAECVEGGFSQV